MVELIKEFGILNGVLLTVIAAQFAAIRFVFTLYRDSIRAREDSADEKLRLTAKLARVAMIAGSAADMDPDKLRNELDGIIRE